MDCVATERERRREERGSIRRAARDKKKSRRNSEGCETIQLCIHLTRAEEESRTTTQTTMSHGALTTELLRRAFLQPALTILNDSSETNRGRGKNYLLP